MKFFFLSHKKKVYYASKKLTTAPKTLNNGYDDENADYIVKLGETFADRYVILSHLGKGSFGQVVKAYDRVKNEYCAIKIIKNKTPFYNQALTEIKLLEFMNKKDANDQYFVGNIYYFFLF